MLKENEEELLLHRDEHPRKASEILRIQRELQFTMFSKHRYIYLSDCLKAVNMEK